MRFKTVAMFRSCSNGYCAIDNSYSSFHPLLADTIQYTYMYIVSHEETVFHCPCTVLVIQSSMITNSFPFAFRMKCHLYVCVIE